MCEYSGIPMCNYDRRQRVLVFTSKLSFREHAHTFHRELDQPPCPFTFWDPAPLCSVRLINSGGARPHRQAGHCQVTVSARQVSLVSGHSV